MDEDDKRRFTRREILLYMGGGFAAAAALTGFDEAYNDGRTIVKPLTNLANTVADVVINDILHPTGKYHDNEGNPTLPTVVEPGSPTQPPSGTVYP